jgi:hypothetical protein
MDGNHFSKTVKKEYTLILHRNSSDININIANINPNSTPNERDNRWYILNNPILPQPNKVEYDNIVKNTPEKLRIEMNMKSAYPRVPTETENVEKNITS